MDKAEEHITGMKSIFGGLINKLRGKTKVWTACPCHPWAGAQCVQATKLDTDVDFPVEWERGKKCLFPVSCTVRRA
jgi:hypothetical protein